MGKEIVNQVQEAERVPYRINLRRNMPRPILITADLLAETLQVRREWQDIFKVMKGENPQPRLLYPTRISFRFDGEIKTFTYKQKLTEFSTTKPAVQQMLKELL